VTTRTLIAGFGNVLRGDDGFGVEVIRRLEHADLHPGVRLLDVGTGGFQLAQELFAPCDRLVIVDAMRRGGEAGSLYVDQITAVDVRPDADMHAAVPSQALGWAKALGVLPPQVVIVGCEPANVDDLTLALSPAVAAAADVAVRRIAALLAEWDGHE
jgi:hydrogenase maturation protease